MPVLHCGIPQILMQATKRVFRVDPEDTEIMPVHSEVLAIMAISGAQPKTMLHKPGTGVSIITAATVSETISIKKPGIPFGA